MKAWLRALLEYFVLPGLGILVFAVGWVLIFGCSDDDGGPCTLTFTTAADTRTNVLCDYTEERCPGKEPICTVNCSEEGERLNEPVTRTCE